MHRSKTNVWTSMNLKNKSLSELITIQDKFIHAHIHFIRHPKKHYEFLSRIQNFIEKHMLNDSSSTTKEDWDDFQYMGGYDNPYFAINNKHARFPCLGLRKKQRFTSTRK
jgi:hypothetical protein